MTPLFESGDLREFLRSLMTGVGTAVEEMPEDELLARSVEDLVDELCPTVTVELLEIGAEVIDHRVSEAMIDVSHDPGWSSSQVRGMRVRASYEYSGDQRLWSYRPSQHIIVRVEATIEPSRLTIESVRPGAEVSAADFLPDLQQQMERIRKQVTFVNADADGHNRSAPQQIRSIIEARLRRIQARRNLSGSLGFPMQRRDDAPSRVPLHRKRLAPVRRSNPAPPYRDEPALTADQYEDAVAVVRSMLVAMERTPSVASGKSEEDLRDLILVQLNGTFSGAATGETFVQRGKTDILVTVEDRHVFVGECKWWGGEKACGDAIDQLLGYMPWRNEKAALILFIDRKDASAVIEKADQVIRSHRAFKRAGARSDDTSERRNFVLGHPDDMDREIYLAALFAVLPRSGGRDG